MSSLFDTQREVLLTLPKSQNNFDVNEISIITKNLTLERFEEQSNYGGGPKIDLGWFVEFSMEDGNHLCSNQEVWHMLMLFRKDYPFYRPLVAIYDDNGDWVKDGHHMDSSKVELFWDKWEAGSVYLPLIDCQSSPSFHIPGFTHSGNHAYQAILWLRSRLDCQKNNRPGMLLYE